MDMTEAKALYDRFTAVVPQHTDVFLSLSEPVAGKSDCKAVGSCVHINYKARKITITCSHVAKEGCIYFTNPKGLSSPHVPEGKHPLVSDITLLKRSEKYDIAIFDSAGLPMIFHGKRRFDLRKSVEVTQALLSSSNLRGLASYIYGVWGNQTSRFIYPDGLAYMQVITYSGIGPINEVSSDLIVTDHSEKQDLRKKNAGSRKSHEHSTNRGLPRHLRMQRKWIMDHER